MSSTDNGKRSRCSRAAKPDYGAFDPDKFWGQVLPSPTTTTDQPDAFDARVERAWRFMRNMFFTPEEHTSAAEAMVRLVSQEQKSKQSPPTHTHIAHEGRFHDTLTKQSR
ncbi:MAG: hypothetical protein D4R77_06810 [Planctomycetaceae bacterium]|nr:MAG: hypothetical protein D4R77_06810 [Planctomycetaceae bacterium]